MTWIGRLFIFFVGVILTLTTGFGIAAFYPEPARPLTFVTPEKIFITESCTKTPEAATSPECLKLQQQQEQQNKKIQQQQQEYQDKQAGYTRTTIFFGVSIGALFTIVGIGFIKRSKMLANGLLLAGVLTMILTRFTVMLASFGSGVTSTTNPSLISYIEFFILVILSLAVIVVGKINLKED